MKLSIVTTLYQSEDYIHEFYERASLIGRDYAASQYEIVFVNDGSPDESLNVAIELHKLDSHVKIVDLSRNFGHHKAMIAGLQHSTGELVFLIDSDLEEQLEWFASFLTELKGSGQDVVYGVQSIRRDVGLPRIAGSMFYKLFRALTEVEQPDNITTARLMTRRYVEALLLHRETEVNIGGLWMITGFSQKAIEVKKLSTSDTTYSTASKINHVVNSITSFSSKPLIYTFYLGVAISLVSMLYVSWLIASYFFFNKPVDGFTTIVASVWLLGGMIIALMGVQGIYIAKVFSEVKRRPLTITRKFYDRSSEGFEKE